MTTVMCAYVGPVMAGYLARPRRRSSPELGIAVPAPGHGLRRRRDVGARRPRAARCARVESGGAAGVTAAGLVGRLIGAADVISFDMGGTTAKAGIVRDGRPRVTHDFQVGGKGSFGGARAGTGVPAQDPGRRPRRGRRGRRQHRLGRRRRRAPGRAAIGRRRSRARVLRAGRHRADGHRRQPRPRLPRSRPASPAACTLSRRRRRRDAIDAAVARAARHRRRRRPRAASTTSSTPTWPPRSAS